jgi:hypothetical protein
MADAQNLPYPRLSAIDEGCTHVWSYGRDLTGSKSRAAGLERSVDSAQELPNIYKRLKMQLHKKTYAEDVLSQQGSP